MNLYGVLGRYIPAFGRIVGRMQYDLFHAYTVDAHTLFVVSNLRRLAIPRYDHELPELSRIMQQLPKPELAYLAALFHDIAKGRGGDHSELGAVDAEAFCLEQGLSRYDARLVAWLVRNHLMLSVTAQKQDIADPQVINEFARTVGDEAHLDYLYVLTCADVRGTNPKLWNSWKASLFEEFYERVKRALRRGLESPIDQEQLVARPRTRARAPAARARHRCEAAIAARLGALHARLLPAPRAGGDRLAHAPARRARRELGRAAGRGRTAAACAAPPPCSIFARAAPAQLRAHHRGARPARPQHRRCAHHADRRRLQPRPLPRARGQRRADHRPRPAGGDRAGAVALAAGPDDTPFAVTRRAPRQVRMFTTPTQIGLSAMSATAARCSS